MQATCRQGGLCGLIPAAPICDWVVHTCLMNCVRHRWQRPERMPWARLTLTEDQGCAEAIPKGQPKGSAIRVKSGRMSNEERKSSALEARRHVTQWAADVVAWSRSPKCGESWNPRDRQGPRAGVMRSLAIPLPLRIPNIRHRRERPWLTWFVVFGPQSHRS